MSRLPSGANSQERPITKLLVKTSKIKYAHRIFFKAGFVTDQTVKKGQLRSVIQNI